MKAATKGLGTEGLLDDLVVEANGVRQRGRKLGEESSFEGGARGARHAEVRELWEQDRVAKGEPSVVKLKGEESAADGWAKHVDSQKMDQHVEACSMARRSGRHELCPRLGDCM